MIGLDEAPDLPAITDPHAARLAAIHEPAMDAMIRDIYIRDYVAFGFDDWRPRR
jgi:hypothetical protein